MKHFFLLFKLRSDYKNIRSRKHSSAKNNLPNQRFSLLFAITLLIFCGSFYSDISAQTACTQSNYTSFIALNANQYPYTSTSGVTVNRTLTNVGAINNFSYNCGGNSYACTSPAWFLNSTAGAITLTFSQPVTSFSIIVNGTNINEEFYHSTTTGVISLAEYCGMSLIAPSSLRSTSTAAIGSLIQINNPAGSTSYTLTVNGVGNGSRYALLDCIVPLTVLLPVTYHEYKAVCVNKKVEVSWSTATELQNDYFTIERSSDGITFYPVGSIEGSKGSTSLAEYKFVDDNPINGIAYYRLKQTDFDLNYSYSDIKSVNCERIGNDGISIFPNPFKETFSISLWSEVTEDVNLTLMDYTGKLIYKETFDKNTTQIDLPVHISEKLTDGVYFVKISSGSLSKVRKLLKIK
jgi:hypothetical protein